MTSFVPCPACGGPVHPIASRCKHCKADLLAHKEEAARSARAQSQSGLRQTFKGQAPVLGTEPGRAATNTPMPAPASAPQLVYAQPSAWSRRWPIAVSALAVVAIVASLLILLGSKDGDDDGRLPSRSGNSPRMVPDDMQTPQPHGSNTPRPPDDPLDPTPFDPPRTGPKPKAWTTAPDAGMFAVALTESVCAKFEDCGMRDPMATDLCRELARGMSTPDVDAKVQSGQCRYDRTAASACLRAVDRLSCDLGSGNVDLADMMSQATGLMECTSALDCD